MVGRAGGLAAIGAALAGAAFAGVEEAVELDAIPAEIMEVAEAGLKGLRLASAATAPVDTENVIDDNIVLVYEELGDVQLVSANTETEEDGSFVYEIQGTVEGGRRVEIDIDPDANIEEIEIEFEIGDVPGAVLMAVEAKYAGFAPEFIEASHSRSMQVIGYEFVGTFEGNAMDIEVSADGRTIVIADQ
ncbi:MAG: hypothetical protein AAFY59_02845 [Pseudomonadota bacterium]